jgi:hypothetical protein
MSKLVCLCAALAMGALLACAASSPAPAVEAPASPEATDPQDAGYVILAALSGSAMGDADVFMATRPVPAPSVDAASTSDRAPPCTCHPPAFVLTPKQSAVLERVRKVSADLAASGRPDQARALAQQVTDIESAGLARCVKWCEGR